MKKTKYRIIEIPTKTSPYYIVEQLRSFLGIKYWEELPEIYNDKNSRYPVATFNSEAEAEAFIIKQEEVKQQKRKVVKELEL